MHLHRCALAVSAVFALAFAGPTAMAQDNENTMSMISMIEIDPSREQQFKDAWSTIRETAEANGYEYTDYVISWRNQRWIVTPLKSFADVDALMAARDAVTEAGGRNFQKAMDKLTGAMTNTHTFFVKNDDELSYWPEGYDAGPYMEIETFHYRYGTKEEMRAILADYKAMMEAKQSPYGYQVSWDGIGTEGNSVTIVSYAENAVALAEANAAQTEMTKDDKEWEALFDRYLKISTGSETMHGLFAPEASINLPEEPQAEDDNS